MSGTEPSVHDGELVRRSLYEPHVFCDVYKRHFEPIYVYCVTRVGSADAEDVAQQVFLVAFVHRDEFEFDRADARPWLCGIARNLCSRHFRTQWQIRHLTHRLPPPPHRSPYPISPSSGGWMRSVYGDPSTRRYANCRRHKQRLSSCMQLTTSLTKKLQLYSASRSEP